jgi:hypothetical protein
MLDWKANLDMLIEETMAFAKRVRVEHSPSVNWTGSEREEIGRRVANFKAHQQRFTREREDYAASEFTPCRSARQATPRLSPMPY